MNVVRQVRRFDGRIENICEHGVGHPTRETVERMGQYAGIHGCDGCCAKDRDALIASDCTREPAHPGPCNGWAVPTCLGYEAGVTGAPVKSRAPFPHCDDLVLHAPGACRHCDKYPERQAQRVADGINFTGEENPEKRSCPATARRSLNRINRWPGNVPRRQGE